MDYIFSLADPRIELVYFVIVVIIAIITGTITRRYYRRNKLSKVQSIAIELLVIYIFLVFSSTVFSRVLRENYSYKLIPFWSYSKIWKGSKRVFWEDVFNVLMLLPVGSLLPIAMLDYIAKGKKRKKELFRRVIFIGFAISLSIEFLQLVLKRGVFEFDDMFHNTLGVAIGYCIYSQIWKKLIVLYKKKKMFQC